jgi:hypothetical protein
VAERLKILTGSIFNGEQSEPPEGRGQEARVMHW